MSRKKAPDPKVAALKRDRALNPSPEEVHDTLFLENPFFDARDLLQVKYEMLRRVEMEDWPVSRTARLFGFSRPSFYAVQKAMKAGGLPGLLARKPGPRGAHKLTGEVLAFVDELRERDPRLKHAAVLRAIETQFSKKVHRRSLERALERRGKERP